MIVLNLSCTAGHRFEGWFASREAFDAQANRGLVACTHCQSTDVTALPSGPRVLRNTASGEAQMPVQQPGGEVAAQLFRLLAQAASKAENVGQRFPEEARRIHYKEAPERAIRGVASAQETLELLEEGIAVLPAPTPADSEKH
jgi:hypothetical protein